METKKIKNIPWKLAMRCAFISGEKIKPKNEAESNYLDLLKAKKAKYDAKRAELNKKQKERIEDIKVNADMLTERILESLIQKEETDKKLKKAEEAAKAAAKDKKIKAAEEKRKRKSNIIKNVTIPNAAKIEEVKKQQDFLAEAHAVKRKEIEKRLDEKYKKCEEIEVKTKEQREKRHEEAMKKALSKIHKAGPKTRTTKEQRIEAIKEAKAKGKAKYEAMIAEHKAKGQDPIVKAKREEKTKKEIERQQRIAERRIERKKKLIAVELSQKKKTESDVKRFLESEKARLVRKKAKRAKYTPTKGSAKVEGNVREYHFEVISLNKDKKEVKTFEINQNVDKTQVKGYAEELFKRYKEDKSFFKLVYYDTKSLDSPKILFNKIEEAA